MAVYLLVMSLCGNNFLHNLLICSDCTDVIHHLCETLHSRMFVETINRSVIERCTRLVKRSRRNARWKHKTHIYRKPFGSLNHILNAVCPHHICNLMRIRYHRGRSMRKHRPYKFSRRNKRALKVDMSIKKSRAHDFARHIDLFITIIFTKSNY